VIQMPARDLLNIDRHATQADAANIASHGGLAKLGRRRRRKHPIQIASDAAQVPTLLNLLSQRCDGGVQVQRQDAIDERKLHSVKGPNVNEVSAREQLRRKLKGEDGRFQDLQAPGVLPLQYLQSLRVDRI
jgi:hypothetical protein